MRVLLVGSGGREHALAWALRRSPRLKELFALPGSDAIAALARPVAGDPLDAEGVAGTCRELSVDLVVVGPEAPLAAGLGDALRARGIPVFGPGRAAARLESSKTFAKSFMERHGIPTARSASFGDPARAREASSRFGFPVVMKADGLAAGKGVRICRDAREAASAIEDFMTLGRLGDSGRTVVLEEFLHGTETTLMGFCDGRSFLALPPSSDHKRLLDGDLGPNTGGMGVLAPTPEATPGLLRRAEKEVVARVLAGLSADGLDYRGILYCGLMLTASGPRVLEFNARFGDPETQAVLPLLTGDLLDLLESSALGDLSGRSVTWKGASACVVLASQGYPDAPVTGRPIEGLDGVPEDALVFHAGTRRDGSLWKTAGGRVLGVTGLGDSLEQARDRAYAAVGAIRFEGMQYRRDIASRRNAATAAEETRP